MATTEAAPGNAMVRPWGFWLTMGFSLVIIGANESIGIVAWPSCCWLTRQWGIPIDNEWLGRNYGLFISVLTWVSAVVCLGLLVAFTLIRKGWSVPEYLALRRVSWKSLGGWVLTAAVFSLVSESVIYHVRHYLVADWSIVICRTARSPALLWSALLIASPISEELVCRGFMFRGIRASSLGAVGAIVVPAMIWAGLHFQYDWYRIATLFASGILLGTARLRSGSSLPPIVIHSLWNFVGFLEVAMIAH